MSGVCDNTFFGHPSGAPGRVQRSTIIFEKSISKILYQTLCLFSKIKEIGISLCRLGHTPGGGTWCWFGVTIFFPNMVVWLIKLKEMVSKMGYKLNDDPMVKLVTLRYICIVNRSIIIKFLRELRDYK